MSHFIEKCICGVQISTCRCLSKDKEVRISNKPCTHIKNEISTGEFPTCQNCKVQFIAVEGTKFCSKCKKAAQSAIEPKRYTAQTLPPKEPDPFVGFKTREVTGYYVKHIDAQVNPLQPTKEAYDEFVEKHTRHYIFAQGWADWNMPIQLEHFEIDIETLRETK